MMMECEIERAKIFWEEVDVDGEFDELMEVLSRLRDAIRHNTATDREYVHAMKIILESKLVVLRNEAFEEVLIDEDILTVTVSESQCSPESLRNGVETEDVLQKDSSRLFECGPWCSCKKSLCQNRVVQKGLRVRLQVFRTLDRGWAVRCSDDLDKGTFICIYAGVVLRLEQSAEEPPDLRSREAPVSDDEVEVVEEWTLPTGPKETVPEMLDCSPPLYVPVIQRPADQSPGAPLTDQQQSQDCSETEREKCEEVLSKKPRLAHTGSNGHNDRADITSHTHQRLKQDKMYYLDASKEGNVARFINHSCEPNLFIQNVFVDTHDPQFPLIAFFTNRSVKAGTELTWNYSYTPGSDPDHEVSCRCASTTCQSLVI
ncbi:histone-lysine N-methyltransferase SETDB2 isoform X3 [Ctenopharyngodon idella]|uniref:histone-lysine N-methyltransferase SETDB2 isoform X3 n=1 Tax=Ctenopharyngodon idella TaxID=7959 RepID=UPI0022328D2C|nr:histone-lysine N-methyltransferase SETDB2 isoform X3 [Ctenopharyngodon idella]